MPKGDRLKLKADPEDGTTPIANLLLEAVAMAKISGLQKGAILYLWRRTYGWVEEGKRIKERKIALSEWTHALDSEKSRISKTLSDLEAMSIIKRRMAGDWGGYYYSINTDIATWNSNCVNLTKLEERITVVQFSTIGENDNSWRKRQQLAKTTTQQLAKTTTLRLAKTTTPLHYNKERLNKVKERKHQYGEFKNVLLSDTEYKKLIERFGEGVLLKKIEDLSCGISSKGYKYTSHYATILNWDRRDKQEGKGGKNRGHNQTNGKPEADTGEDGGAKSKYTTGRYGSHVRR